MSTTKQPLPVRTFALTITAAPITNDEAGIHRLRRLLKCLVRQYAMRVVEITEIKAAAPPEAAAEKGQQPPQRATK